MEQRADGLEILRRIDQRGRHEGRRQQRHTRAERVDDKCDAERHTVTRLPTTEPVDNGAVRALVQQESTIDYHHQARQDGDGRGHSLADERRDGNKQCGGKQGNRQRQRREPLHRDHALNERALSGSSVPLCLCDWIASASNSAVTVAPTTISVNASA